MQSNNKNNIKFENINNNIKLLDLDIYDNNLLKTYKNIIINKDNLKKHNDIISLLLSKEYIFNQQLISNKIFIKKNNKILLLRKVEEYFNLNPLEVDFQINKLNDFKELEEILYNNIKLAYRISLKNPQNYNEFRKFYVNMIRHIGTNEIVYSKQLNQGEMRKKYEYKLNNLLLEKHIKLIKYTKNFNKYHIYFINKYNLNNNI